MFLAKFLRKCFEQEIENSDNHDLQFFYNLVSCVEADVKKYLEDKEEMKRFRSAYESITIKGPQ